jgi:hypothetical protein
VTVTAEAGPRRLQALGFSDGLARPVGPRSAAGYCRGSRRVAAARAESVGRPGPSGSVKFARPRVLPAGQRELELSHVPGRASLALTVDSRPHRRTITRSEPRTPGAGDSESESDSAGPRPGPTPPGRSVGDCKWHARLRVSGCQAARPTSSPGPLWFWWTPVMGPGPAIGPQWVIRLGVQAKPPRA